MLSNFKIYIFFYLIILPFLVLTGMLYAQQQIGTITGRLNDKYPHLENHIIIRLAEFSTKIKIQETEPDSTGSFILRNVPFSSYDLIVLVDNFVIKEKKVVINSPIPVFVDMDSLQEYETGEVLVTADNYANNQQLALSKTIYNELSIQSLPSQSADKLIENVLLNTPGVVPDEDGRMHVRGEDAQLQYVIDGIPVSGNMTRIYSGLFDANLIKSVNIQTGNLEAEYGVATAGVLAITTHSGFDKPLFLNASASIGSFNTKDFDIQTGGNIGMSSALFLGFNTSSTNRYLDPINEGDPIHDDGTSYDFFGKVNTILNQNNELSVLTSYNGTEFSVPNSIIKVPAQDQRHKHDEFLIGARLNTVLSSNALLSFLTYQRYAKAKITSGGLFDLSAADYQTAISQNEKFFIGGERMNTTIGGQIEYSLNPEWFSHSNNFKAGIGFEIYPLSEKFSFAVTNTALSDTGIAGSDRRFLPYDITRNGSPFFVDQSKTGSRYSAFAQDQVVVNKWIFSAGLRFDYFRFLQNEFYLSPRINAAYNINNDFVIRASYNRIVMQAPLENILVSSSDEARKLSGFEQGAVPTNVGSEKEHNFELGAGYHIKENLDVEVIGYGKIIQDFLVKAELGNTGVIFPVNLKNGFVAGGELRIRLNNWNNFSGYMSFSTCASYGLKPEDGSSPIAAGLIFGEEGQNYNHPFSGEDRFPTEHNQLFTGIMNIQYNHPGGSFWGLNGRFDSGLPFDLTGKNGEGLDPGQARKELKSRGYSDNVIDLLSLESEEPGSPDKSVAPHMIFDLIAGYDLEKTLSLPLSISVAVLNVLNTPFLYKFESSFGGTHFGYPRMLSLRVETRY